MHAFNGVSTVATRATRYPLQTTHPPISILAPTGCRRRPGDRGHCRGDGSAGGAGSYGAGAGGRGRAFHRERCVGMYTLLILNPKPRTLKPVQNPTLVNPFNVKFYTPLPAPYTVHPRPYTIHHIPYTRLELKTPYPKS